MGTLLRSRIVDETSPIAYGVNDSLAVISDDGGSFSVGNHVGRRFRRFGEPAAGPPAAARLTTPTWCRAVRRSTRAFELPRTTDRQAVAAGPVTDDSSATRSA